MTDISIIPSSPISTNNTTSLFEESDNTSKSKEIFTYKTFDWAWRNPLVDVFSWENDFVTEQWSPEYFLATKNEISKAKESILNFIDCLDRKNFRGQEALEHLANAFLLFGLTFINVEVTNVIKGIIGTLSSTVKLPAHFLSAITCFLIGISACLLDSKFGINLLEKSLSDFGLFAKDIISIIICLGHSIPTWLPFLLMVTCPPAGAAAMVISFLSNYSGITDIASYGGTALLLFTKATYAKSKKERTPEDEVTIELWNRMKKELSPSRTFEGALLSMFAIHILCQGTISIINLYAPLVGDTLKYVAYAIYCIGALLLTSINVNHKQLDNQTLPGNTKEEDSKIPVEAIKSESIEENKLENSSLWGDWVGAGTTPNNSGYQIIKA